MYHSLIINVGEDYINTWDDWFLIPSSRPVISPPIERTKFATVPGRDGNLDYSQSISGKPTFDNRTGKIEFYLENDIPNWDWETAYTTICETLKGQRVRMALEDNPAHYYEGLIWVSQYKSSKGHSTITLEYNLHPTMKTLNVGAVVMNVETLQLTKGMEFQLLVGVGPTNTFFRKVTVTAAPKGIVEITKNGTVKGLKKGTAVITAECGGEGRVHGGSGSLRDPRHSPAAEYGRDRDEPGELCRGRRKLPEHPRGEGQGKHDAGSEPDPGR